MQQKKFNGSERVKLCNYSYNKTAHGIILKWVRYGLLCLENISKPMFLFKIENRYYNSGQQMHIQ